MLVIGSGWLDTNDSTGVVESRAEIGVSADCEDGTPTLDADQTNRFSIPPSAGSGFWAAPYSAQKIFSVASAGAKTFCIVAEELTGAMASHDPSLSLLYIPTSYGDVDQTRPGAVSTGDRDDRANARQGGLTASDIAAEQARAAAANQARIDRELAEMRARIAELERYLEQVHKEQGLGDTTGGGR